MLQITWIKSNHIKTEDSLLDRRHIHVATGRLELKTLTPFCIEERAYLVRRAPVVCFSPHRSLKNKQTKKIVIQFFNGQGGWFTDSGFHVFLNVRHPLYVRRDVVLRPFLSEREEVVEALERVLWKILHPQQADGLRVGGAVHQGNALQHLQWQRIRNETKGATQLSFHDIWRLVRTWAWWHMERLSYMGHNTLMSQDSSLFNTLTFSWSSLVLMPSGTLCCQTSWNSLRLNLTAFWSNISARPWHTLCSFST